MGADSIRHDARTGRGERLRILHVNTLDEGGGAERNSRALAAGCRKAGHAAWLAVGRKLRSDPHTLLINDERSGAWSRAMLRLGTAAGKVKPIRRHRQWLRRLAFPVKSLLRNHVLRLRFVSRNNRAVFDKFRLK